MQNADFLMMLLICLFHDTVMSLLSQRSVSLGINAILLQRFVLFLLCISDKSKLRQYLIDGYKDKLDVTLLPDWKPLQVSNIFTPAILICDREKQTQEKEKFRNLGTYRELFYDNDVLQMRVILLGEAGAGKTTFSKHLTDLWCEPRTKQQFADVTVIKEFKYFFYVSCRFAKEGDIIADMIKDQIFGDDKLKDVATYMLKHYPECCLIVLDGADEWRGSPDSDTGRRGDIAGLPGMEGVEQCVILITSRPWRFHSLPTRSRSIFRRLQINGIKDVQVLAYRILQKMEYPDPAESSYKFLHQVRQNNMYELMKTPLILIIALGGWVNDKSFHKSMCINYINMIQSFIRRSKGQAGWSSSKIKLQHLIPNLEALETGWGTKANELPYLLLRYKSIQRYAGLCLLLGQLAFDLLLGKEEQSLVFSKQEFQSYLPADDENDESVNVCLALGILSKTETTTRGIRKLESYAFCHKTFQEFFAALWLASKYSNEKSKLFKCIKTLRNLDSYEILITFLCEFDLETGKLFWVDLAEEVEVKLEEEKDEREKEKMVKDLQKLVCKHMKKHGFDLEDQTSDQVYFCIPHIVIDYNTSNEDIILLCHVMEEFPCNVKSLSVDEGYSFWNEEQHLSGQQTLGIYRSVSSCSGLQSLTIYKQQSDSEERGSLSSPVRDLQKHDKLEKLVLRNITIEGLLLPVEGARITSLRLWYVTMSLHGCEQLSESLSSCSHLEDLSLGKVRCREHSDSCCIPVIDLQKHDKLKTLELNRLSIEVLLLPGEGARITSLELGILTMTHHGCEQLSESLSSCSHLEDLSLGEVRCREHSDSCCIPVIDLQKHDKLKTLELNRLSIEGLLLPVEGARITSLKLGDVTMSHHGCETLSESLSSCSHLEDLDLDKVRCREHSDTSCIPVLDLQKHDKLKTLGLQYISIEGLLLPVEGARITSLRQDNVTMPHHDCETLSESLSSCFHLEYLSLDRVRCREHGDSCCIPVLALQKHDKLKKLELRMLSIEGLLLPVEGAIITSLRLFNVTMSHHSCEQLSESLSPCSHLEDLDLGRVSCNEHSDSYCLPVLDLQKHDKLETLKLRWLSIEALRLPVEGARITSLELWCVTMSHHSCGQLSESLSSCSHLENLDLDKVRCREHSDSFCIPVLDLQNHDKLMTLDLQDISIEGLLLPVEGARITWLRLDKVTMSHHSCGQLSESLSSCSHLEDLDLDKVRCREHSDSFCIPVLDLQKHDKLMTLDLQDISIEGLLLPVEGARITWLRLDKVTMSHHGCEQLSAAFSSRAELQNWRPFRSDLHNKVICREHSDSSCQPVKDITNFIRGHRKVIL